MAQGLIKRPRTSSQLAPDAAELLQQSCARLAALSGKPAPENSADALELLDALDALTRDLAGNGLTAQQDVRARELQTELENVERLKNRFIRNVSHELRTPLASIDGFARALLRMETPDANNGHCPAAELISPDTRRQFLAIISQEAQRLGKFIEDVLDLSEIESNQLAREPSLFVARELFDEALKAVLVDCRALNVVIRLAPEPDGPPLYADRDAIVEVLRQLLSNAQKFSAGQEVVLGAERVSITPATTAISASGQMPRITSATRLYVRDRGVGIPTDELDRIFQKFYRIERPGFYIPGSGLGLSIARALINQNNGQIWAESESGRGATFYVLLPDSAPGVTP